MPLNRNAKIAIGAGVAVLGVFVIAREVEKARKRRADQDALDKAKKGGEFATVFETITQNSPVTGSGATTVTVPASASLPLCTSMFPDRVNEDGAIVADQQFSVIASREGNRLAGRCR